MFNFIRGDLVPCRFQPFGGNLGTLNVKAKSADIEALLFEVTSTGSGGVTARLAGKIDGSGTIQMDLDADLLPWQTFAMLPGISGILLHYVTPTRAIQIPIIIGKLHEEDAIESEVKVSYEWKLNSLAGQLVYPAI